MFIILSLLALTAAILFIPHCSRWGQIALCWLTTGCLWFALSEVESFIAPQQNDYLPFVPMMGIIVMPFLLAAEAVVICFISELRKSSRVSAERHEHFLEAVKAGDVERVNQLLPGVHPDDTDSRNISALKYAILAATDTLHTPPGNPVQIARILLQAGADAGGCLDAIVQQHELLFEATEQDSPVCRAAVCRTAELIPLLAAAGDTISTSALNSARYNCAPIIQQALFQVKQTPVELPEE